MYKVSLRKSVTDFEAKYLRDMVINIGVCRSNFNSRRLFAVQPLSKEPSSGLSRSFVSFSSNSFKIDHIKRLLPLITLHDYYKEKDIYYLHFCPDT